MEQADAHSINISWLLTGKGDMLIASNGSAINTGAGGVAKVEAQNEKLIQMLADKKAAFFGGF